MPRRYIREGRQYRSKKHPLLEYIFRKYNPKMDNSIKSISFTLADIHEAYENTDIVLYKSNGTQESIGEPASISNTILDLVRQNRGIESRLPSSIISLGYDLRKKTGPAPNGANYAGEFVYVGVGNVLRSWLEWPKKIEEITISSRSIPPHVINYIRNDEGGLFSVIDYCDVLTKILGKGAFRVFKVQNPVKWQPNEIDGMYLYEENNIITLITIEAKALTTGDLINLDQVLGAINKVTSEYRYSEAIILPLAIKMITNGMMIAIFAKCKTGTQFDYIELTKAIQVTFNPPIQVWQ